GPRGRHRLRGEPRRIRAPNPPAADGARGAGPGPLAPPHAGPPLRRLLLRTPPGGGVRRGAGGDRRPRHGGRPARAGADRVAAATVAVGLVLGWSVGVRSRNLTWHDERSLAESMVASAPDSAHAHAALAAAYSSVGRDEDALREFLQALSITPKDAGLLYDVG